MAIILGINQHLVVGDLVVTGDLTVQGSATIEVDHTVLGDMDLQGQLIIDTDNVEALLVRADGDGGDVFAVDTINGLVTISSSLIMATGDIRFGSTPALSGTLRLSYTDTIISRNAGDSGDIVLFDSLDSDEWQLGDVNMDGFRIPTRINLDDVLKIQFTSQEALDVRNAAGSTKFLVDTTNSLVFVRGGASLAFGTTPALTGTIRLQNSDSIIFRDSEDTVDIPIISFAGSDILDIGDNSNPGELEELRLNCTQILIPAGNLLIRGDSDAALQIRQAAGSVVFEVNSTDREIKFTGPNGAETEDKFATTTVLTSAGSSVTAAALIPAGSFVIGITTRVITTVTGPTGYDVGDGVDVDFWGSSIAVALGTTSDITDYTSSSLRNFPTANDVVITSDGVDFTGGEIRIIVHYRTLTAPGN